MLTYDIRNHGNSSAANNGLSGIGQWEWRDCVGIKKFVDNRSTLSKMKLALYSQCMGGNSQYHAIHRRPDLFENVRCMVSPMVVSMAAIYDAFLIAGREAVPGIDRSGAAQDGRVCGRRNDPASVGGQREDAGLDGPSAKRWLDRNPEDTEDLRSTRQQGEGTVLD
ncbi:MAG: hypothetical protein R3B74_08750 [Nitrospirales bacterium]|nr:hypothetical protein [Nitrospirales bacterium]